MKGSYRKAAVLAGTSLTLILGAGCAGDKTKSAVTSAKTSAAPHLPSNDIAATNAVSSRSEFQIDQNSRDPFFPRANRTATADTGGASGPATSEPRVDLGNLLKSGLQGIGSAGESRIAVINNVMLEPGRPATIPVRIGDRDRSLQVRCREVTKNSVVLDVEGYGPLVVTQKQTL